jgi:hypothetical protein
VIASLSVCYWLCQCSFLLFKPEGVAPVVVGRTALAKPVTHFTAFLKMFRNPVGVGAVSRENWNPG